MHRPPRRQRAWFPLRHVGQRVLQEVCWTLPRHLCCYHHPLQQLAVCFARATWSTHSRCLHRFPALLCLLVDVLPLFPRTIRCTPHGAAFVRSHCCLMRPATSCNACADVLIRCACRSLPSAASMLAGYCFQLIVRSAAPPLGSKEGSLLSKRSATPARGSA